MELLNIDLHYIQKYICEGKPLLQLCGRTHLLNIFFQNSIMSGKKENRDT